MKRLTLILLMCGAFCVASSSQNRDLGFLFDIYKDGTIHFKGNTHSPEKINYNLIDNKLYFVDKKDGQIKIVSDISRILYIKVEDRSFLFYKDGLKEVVSTTPLIYVQYNVKSQKKASKVGYGGTSQLSSTTNYAVLRDGGAESVLKEDEREITDHYNYYWIEKDNKKKRFANFKDFVKIYPKQKASDIEKYIQQNNIEFEDIEAIVELCKYAEGL